MRRVNERKEDRKAAKERELRQAIPSLKHMRDSADVVEFIDLFEGNMEAREVPKDLWAQMCTPLLSQQPLMAVQALSQLERQSYKSVKEAALGTCVDAYKRAGASFFSICKEKDEGRVVSSLWQEASPTVFTLL